MRLRVFGSGSQGNALAVRSGGTLLLVDCGFSCRELERRMAACGVRADDVTALLFTHDHTDHCKGIATFHKRHPQVPLYANGNGRHGYAGWHLHGRVERVESVQRAARHRYADHRQHRACRQHAAEMRRAACCGDDHLDAARLCGLRVLQRHVGRAVRTDDARLVGDAESVERRASLLNEGPVAVRPHHDSNKRFFAVHVYSP